jgi:quercetin dioxygenase-like cupin family protein
VNLLVLNAGEAVEEHVNTVVDVLLVGIAGAGIVRIDGLEHGLAAGQVLIVPKGTRRSIASAGGRFAYLTCHRRRGGLWPVARA